ncbi:MAG: pantetheine-phosphate adenylyltransferase [Heliobacteriaceae bacterium]|nr:pantetheine-phosphate adenylyltransferase [Heliobacteriaceae bacterium]MDD4587001.1 pantetheine-phosphate adenylyltransferase [Heliobacteriaceae bacterium]
MGIAVYPGSFDPVTNGHMDIVERAAQIFDEVIVAVVINPDKRPLFTMDERLEMIKQSCTALPNVRVGCFSGLLVDFMRQEGAKVIIRGLRAVSDFENEFQMALMNKKLHPGIETVFFTSQTEYAFLSSSLVKEVASLGGDVYHFLPAAVLAQMQIKYGASGSGERAVSKKGGE